MAGKAETKKVYGDFQTPPPLAEAAIAALQRLEIKPGSVLEPTCGKGAFLLAAFQAFPEAARFIGVDINAEYLQELRLQSSSLARQDTIQLWRENFFSFDWQALLSDLPQPILIVGNPPWVTSSDLGIWNSDNLPPKSNFQKRRGFEAVTGKSKFDISEWMLLQHREDGDELFELVSRTESLVRQQGLYPEAQVDLERRLAQVAEEQAHARPNERLLGSSEVIESVLGKMKRLEQD